MNIPGLMIDSSERFKALHEEQDRLGGDPSMLESKIQTKILKNLKAAGVYAHKNITTNRKGIPDIICCYGGIYIALEVKRPGGKATELQMWNLQEIKIAGGIARIVYSWEDVKKILEEVDDIKP